MGTRVMLESLIVRLRRTFTGDPIGEEYSPFREMSRFTDRALKVVQLARDEAWRLNHEYLGTEHLLLGLLREGTGTAINVLDNLHVERASIKGQIEAVVFPGAQTVTLAQLPATPRAKKAVEHALEESLSLKHNYLGTEHILLGLLHEQASVAGQVLMNAGLTLEA